jgi:hypothetical protein
MSSKGGFRPPTAGGIRPPTAGTTFYEPMGASPRKNTEVASRRN